MIVFEFVFHPGNRDEAFIWKNFHPGYRDLDEHIKLFTKEIGVKRDLGNRAIPFNRDHMKRPLEKLLHVEKLLH